MVRIDKALYGMVEIVSVDKRFFPSFLLGIFNCNY